MTTMRCGRGLGTAKACPPALARRTLGGSGASQVVTGNAEGLALVGALAVGRLAIVAGAARTVMAMRAPSASTSGQVAQRVMTRGTAIPPGPIATKAARMGSAASMDSSGGP